jgi:hypothetical protein
MSPLQSEIEEHLAWFDRGDQTTQTNFWMAWVALGVRFLLQAELERLREDKILPGELE